MYIYNWQEKKEENQALEDFCHAPASNQSTFYAAIASGRSPLLSLAETPRNIKVMHRLLARGKQTPHIV
ncbi:MAG: hypothetical protein ABSG78_25345 [Verrucomicrobiota bacterium]